jgi:N-hydroxyarylamine O-acetyltransferase
MKLEPYFERIGFRGDPKPDLKTLTALHWLHPIAIPFENLNTLLGERVRLDEASLIDKLIHRRRGGYCFEQNSLFRFVLETIGFELTPIAARVVWNADKNYNNPRTHMAMIVDIAGERFLCDVGFGGVTLTAPLAFESGVVQATPHEPFRILTSGELFTLEVQVKTGWRAAYEFDLQPQQAIDYEAMNYYVATHPDSHFRYHLMAARPYAGGRFSLGGNQFSRFERGLATEKRPIQSGKALEALLKRDFQLTLPDHPDLGPLLERVASARSE